MPPHPRDAITVTGEAACLPAAHLRADLTGQHVCPGRIQAADVVAVLDRLALERGPPPFIRFDNGPELVAHAVADWARSHGTATVFIDPGSPWQNAWIESFNG